MYVAPEKLPSFPKKKKKREEEVGSASAIKGRSTPLNDRVTVAAPSFVSRGGSFALHGVETAASDTLMLVPCVAVLLSTPSLPSLSHAHTHNSLSLSLSFSHSLAVPLLLSCLCLSYTLDTPIHNYHDYHSRLKFALSSHPLVRGRGRNPATRLLRNQSHSLSLSPAPRPFLFLFLSFSLSLGTPHRTRDSSWVPSSHESIVLANRISGCFSRLLHWCYFNGSSREPRSEFWSRRLFAENSNDLSSISLPGSPFCRFSLLSRSILLCVLARYVYTQK